MRTVAAAVFVAAVAAFATGCGDDGFKSSGTTYVQTPVALPPPPLTVAPGPAGPGFRPPAGLAEAVAFDDGTTLDVISCQITTATEPGTQYELSLVGEEIFEVLADPDDVVTRVSALSPSPDLNSTQAGGTLEGTVLTGTAVFAPNDFEWTQLAFAFDTENCA